MNSHTLFPALLKETGFVAVDVGAAHWLPHHWRLFQDELEFVLIEPDRKACEALAAQARERPAPERYKVVQAALSGSGGERSFYCFNTLTWSSLLPPAISVGDPDWLFHYPKIDDPSYIYPVIETKIQTTTLASLLPVIKDVNMIKLDTQGTELEILLGLGEKALQEVAIVQMEAGDHGHYHGQPGLGEVLVEMKKRGFTLYDIQLARGSMPLRGDGDAYPRALFPSDPSRDPSLVWRLHEVDAVFVRDPMLAVHEGNADKLRRTIVALCVYRLFAHAYQLTGIGEMHGLWDTAMAMRYRRDVIRCHKWVKERLDEGVRLFWERT